jgi:hypothetical protein
VRARACKALHMRLQRDLFGIHAHAQAYLPRLSSHRPQHWRTVIGKGAASAPLVGTRTWRVNGQLISPEARQHRQLLFGRCSK